MKKVMVLLSIAVVLAAALIILPTTKTAHADGGCAQHSGIYYQIDQGPNTFGSYQFDANGARADLWPCISSQGNTISVNAYASFRVIPVYTLNWYNVISICKLDLALRNADTGVVVQHKTYDCNDAYSNQTVGAAYGNGYKDLNNNRNFTYSGYGRWWVTANINVWYYDSGCLHMETGIQGTSTISTEGNPTPQPGN